MPIAIKAMHGLHRDEAEEAHPDILRPNLADQIGRKDESQRVGRYGEVTWNSWLVRGCRRGHE